MPQHIIVCDYQPAWQQAYRAEAQKIRAILGENLVCIHHIGSTAVPGLAAKPVIDILPVVRSLAQADAAAPAFAAIGYEYLGEFGIAGRRYLRKGGDARAGCLDLIHTTIPPCSLCAARKGRTLRCILRGDCEISRKER